MTPSGNGGHGRGLPGRGGGGERRGAETYEGVWHVGSGVVRKTWWADCDNKWVSC